MGDSRVVERGVARNGAQAMGFPDESFQGQLLKVGGKFVAGRGPRGGELGGLRRLLPFKRVAPALPLLPGAGRGLGKFVFVAGKAPDGRRGRASAAVPPSCFREAVGATRSARRGGPGARLPVPGRLEEEGGGGRAGAERGAHVRPSAGISRLARRAEQARGPGGGALTLEQPELEEEEEERRRGRRRRRGGGKGGGGGESLPPGEHGAPGAEASAAGAPVAG